MRKFVSFIILGVCVLISGSIISAQITSPYVLRLQTFLTGLTRPVLIRNAKDGSNRLFIVQQTGIIKVLQPGSNAPTDFTNLSSKIVVPVVAGDERGLLGLTFHPQFAANGKFYVNYTRAGDGATVIAEYRTTTGSGNSNAGDISTEKILLTIPQPFTNHNGGMIEFGADGYLYIGMGDGGSANDPGARAQNPAQLLGKMLRIDVNVPNGSTAPYSIPPTNPFTGANTARCDAGSAAAGNACQEIYTVGMRNPWRWSFDRTTNQLWVADVGQDAIEEVDVISNGGGNYGWRVYEGTQCTSLDPSLCTASNYIMPTFQYSHTAGRCSITGGYVYRGTQNNLPNGAYVYADYCTGEIWMWNGSQQILLQDTPRNIVSFGEDESGELYVCYSNGQIDKMTRARANADFDGDAKTDFSLYRFSVGTWYILNSSNNSVRAQQFGTNEDGITPEDYDGDNITDLSVYRVLANTWYRLNSSNNTFVGVQFGQLADSPAQADYDGDGKADIAVYRRSNGYWYRINSSNNQFVATQWGADGDLYRPGDYDGDGKTDVNVFRPSNGTWYRINSSNGAKIGIQFGANGDVPISGDFDGDGKIDLALVRASASNTDIWYILQSSTGTVLSVQFGLSTDNPQIVGDYDGDGRDDIAVYRTLEGIWYVLQSSNGAVKGIQFGTRSDAPSPVYDVP